MDESLDQLCHEVDRSIDAGDLEHALDRVRAILRLGDDCRVSYVASAFLIDLGTQLSQVTLVEEGTRLLEKDLMAIEQSDGGKFTASAHYNLANGYYSLSVQRGKEETSRNRFFTLTKTDLDSAREYYMKTLGFNPTDRALKTKVLVNLGNCLDRAGRVLDALECYGEALRLTPDHAMALGNKGIGLVYYAMVAGEHRGTYLREAHHLLNQALTLGAEPQAVPYFKQNIQWIRNQFGPESHSLDSPVQFPGCTVTGESDMERSWTRFCLDNRLYLNGCNFCQRCDAAMGDTATIRRMTVPMDDNSAVNWPNHDPFLRLSAYVNQIKQDYVTARFLLFLSTCKELRLDFVNKRVKIIDTLDYSIHHIRTELVKSAFKGFYDILDKISFLVRDYLKIALDDRNTSFRTVWYERGLTPERAKQAKICTKVIETNNASLNALFDLYRDFDVGHRKHLRLMRHALTHRFMSIREYNWRQDEEGMDEPALLERTLELARLVRNAVVYSLYFIDLEERRRHSTSHELTAPLLATDLPDNLKRSRLGDVG